MKKNKFFNIKTLLSFIISISIISMISIVIASPDLEKDIKDNLSIYMNYLNNGKISEYYDIYNTRKLNDVEKLTFYDRIKNSTKVVSAELKTFEKFKFKIKIKDVNILRRLNNNTYLCNLKINYRIRENIDTTKTIKKSEDYILKIIYLGAKEGYKILLPFNSLDRDFSQGNFFVYLDNLYKTNKAKEIEEQRLLEEDSKDETINNDVEDLNMNDENGLYVDSTPNDEEDLDDSNSINEIKEDNNVTQEEFKDNNNTESNDIDTQENINQ